MNLAPVILFVYNRPDHAARTLERLRQNKEAPDTDLVIYSDGAKNENGKPKVDEVRAVIASVTGFKSVTVNEQKENLGLARSVIGGVTETMKKFGKAIILEDDIAVGKHYLDFMNRGLEKYAGDDRVASVAGYNFPVAGKILPDSFFLRGADCWGWGAWKRSWDLFEPDASKLLEAILTRKLQSDLDMDGAYPYTGMLQSQISGKVDSWAIRWYTSVFLSGKMTLYPGKSIVQNIGFDGSGVHGGVSNVFDAADIDHRVATFPEEVGENRQMRGLRIEFFRKMHGGKPTNVHFLRKVLRKVRDFFLRRKAKS